jgi:hypothetical protein
MENVKWRMENLDVTECGFQMKKFEVTICDFKEKYGLKMGIL